MTELLKLDRLKGQLLTSGLSQSNSALYQVINQLIDATRQLQNNIATNLTVTPTTMIIVGKYTPTLTNVVNLDGSTAYECQYVRVDNIVFVTGKVDINPTLAAVSTQLGISLPIVSNLGATEDCSGNAFSPTIAGQGAAILGDVANNRAQMEWISTDLTNQPMYFSFGYEIL